MSIVGMFLHYLIYMISLSDALQCTTNCFFTLNFDSPFEIPAKCNETTSARQCKVDLSISYGDNFIFVSLSANTLSINLEDYHHAMAQVSDDGSTMVSYSVSRYCKNKDDCARNLARQSMWTIINRPLIDPQSIGNELFPLLSSNSSHGNTDLHCFDNNENVRQCSIASKPGVCGVSHQLIGRKTITRSCNNKYLTRSQHVMILDSNKSASFNIECNRFLCNGPMTLQTVKEILFKYNLTQTIEGRLNNGFRLSFSLLLIVFIVFCWFEK